MKKVKELAKKSAKKVDDSIINGEIQLNPPINLIPKTEEDDLDMKENYDFLLNDCIDFSDLMEMFDGDLSDIDEMEDLVEDLSFANRQKKRAVIRRNRSRIRIARKRAMNRRATQKVVSNRARKMAIRQLKTRFAQGRPINKLSYAERNRVERMIKRRRPSVVRLQRRLVRTVRKNEMRRLNNSFSYDFTSLNDLFEAFNTISDQLT